MLNGTAYRREAAHDLTVWVNPFCVAGATQRTEIRHYSISPEERMMVLAARRSWQVGCAHHASGIGDPGHEAGVPSQRAQVLHHSALPKKGVINKSARRRIHISRESRCACDLTPVVQQNSGPIDAAECSTERAEIDHSATLPKEGMNRWYSGGGVWRCACSRNPRHLPPLIHSESTGIKTTQSA